MPLINNRSHTTWLTCNEMCSIGIGGVGECKVVPYHSLLCKSTIESLYSTVIVGIPYRVMNHVTNNKYLTARAVFLT